MRILVTGASGLIGSNLAAAAVQQSWSVLGAWHREPVEIAGASTIALDLSDRSACVMAAMQFEPDVIVHAAPGRAPGLFERDPQLGRLCSLAAEHTLAAARTVRARYLLVSCDWVFSGLRPAGQRWDEHDLPEPVNAYGRAQLAAEGLVRESRGSWLITRVADVYGVNLSKPVGGARWRSGGPFGDREAHQAWERSGSALRLVGRLRDGNTLLAPADVHRSPTYAWDYAQRVCELLAQGCEGVIHTTGPDSVHRREYLRLLARAFDCDPELVRDGSLAAYLESSGEDQRLPLPPNTALDDERARTALGHPSVDVEAGLWLMNDQLRRVLDRT